MMVDRSLDGLACVSRLVDRGVCALIARSQRLEAEEQRRRRLRRR